MLTHLTFEPTAEWTKKLPFWKEGSRTIEFKPGLNILYGPNGCGKTTTLQAIMRYTMCSQNGQNFFPPSVSRDGRLPHELNDNNAYYQRLSEEHRHNAKGISTSGPWSGNRIFAGNIQQITAAVSCIDEVFERIGGIGLWAAQRTASEGESTLNSLLAILETLLPKGEEGEEGEEKLLGRKVKLPPTLQPIPEEEFSCVNDTWQACMRHFNSHVPEPNDGHERKVTLILDEPDRSLSICNQRILVSALEQLPRTGLQVIVALHTPFALVAKDAHFVYMDPDSMKETHDALDWFVQRYESPGTP